MRRVLKVLALAVLIAGLELTTGAFSHAFNQLGKVYAELALDAEPSVSLDRFFLGVGALVGGLLLLLLDIWARAAWSGVNKGKVCPVCGGKVERVRRRYTHRIMGWILGRRVTRRKCQECEWAGLMT